MNLSRRRGFSSRHGGTAETGPMCVFVCMQKGKLVCARGLVWHLHAYAGMHAYTYTHTHTHTIACLSSAGTYCECLFLHLNFLLNVISYMSLPIIYLNQVDASILGEDEDTPEVGSNGRGRCVCVCVCVCAFLCIPPFFCLSES